MASAERERWTFQHKGFRVVTVAAGLAVVVGTPLLIYLVASTGNGVVLGVGTVLVLVAGLTLAKGIQGWRRSSGSNAGGA